MNRPLLRLGVCFLLLGGCSRTPDRVTLAGRVVGHDGKPMRSGLALVQGMGVKERAAIDSRGRFSLAIQQPGAYYLWLIGVHHRTLLRPLFIERPGRIRIEAHLGAAQYVERMDSVLVIGDFNDFSVEQGGRTMKRFSDGTFQLTVEAAADTLAYQLIGVQTEGRPLAGTLADRYVCPRGTMLFSGKAGSMVSVLRATGDSVRISFDPGSLPRSGNVEGFRFEDSRSRPARLVTLYEDLQRRFARYSDSIREHKASGRDMEEFVYDWSTDRAALRSTIDNETDPVLQQYLLLGYFSLSSPGPEDSVLARRVLAEIPPASLVWSLEWGGPRNTFVTVERSANQPAAVQAYADRASEEHPDRTVRAAFLYSSVQLAFRARERELNHAPSPDSSAVSPAAERFSLLYDRLMTEYGDTREAEFARKFYAPNRNIQPGHEIPDFAVVSLDDSTVTWTPRSLRGRAYLIDFWAIWCGPCVAELPYLHAAHEMFRHRGFTILSLSLDKHPNDVMEYRRSTWPMPWLHAFLTEGWQSELLQRFEVVGIPRPILVDSAGTIRATDLRGKKLEEALAAMFEEER